MLARDPNGNPTELQLDTSKNLKVVGAASDSYVAVNIAQNANITPAIDLGSARLARIAMPGGWDAAGLSFQVSYDNVVWNDLYDATGTEYSVVAASGRSIIVPLADFLGIRYLKIRSGKSAAAVNQSAQRTLVLGLA